MVHECPDLEPLMMTTMALEPCPECGHNVSTTAQVCPNCGKPTAFRQRQQNWLGLVLVVVFVLVATWLGLWGWLYG